MTTEGAALDAGVLADDGRMFCYRHPDRETYVRCGRCDRPICTRCAMQGPVGFRCKQCGTLANDPLTTFRPNQIVFGSLVAAGGGLVLGLVSGAIGFFTILIAFFGGGIIAEAVMRVTGIKRGPIMYGIVMGGIVAGILIGGVLSYAWASAQFAGLTDENGEPIGLTLGVYLASQLPWMILSSVAACVGAYTRLR